MEAASSISYEGRPAIIANLVDVTEGKQQEENLKRDEEKYRDLCENASDMIQCIAPDGRLVYVNKICREITIVVSLLKT